MEGINGTCKSYPKLKVLDLFCGTKSISKSFEKRCHEVYSIDWDESFNPSLIADIGQVTTEDIFKLCGGRPDIIWASPDCTTYSIAAISHHRTRDDKGLLLPKSPYAKQCDKVNAHVISLIQKLNPKYWFIENPRGGMRKATFMQELNKYRYTVTYCQYGDNRMKPTDIWTNYPNPKFKPMCKNGDSCHERAPRGSKTGTQGLKDSVNRSRIPKKLCEHIVNICESHNIIKGGV